MIDITKSKTTKYLLFSSQYFNQGIIIAIIRVILPLYLLEIDYPIPLVTLITGLIWIPWSIKFIWGGIVDYYIRFGRKIFIILGNIMFALGLIISTLIDPNTSLIGFTFFLFISVCGVVFLDVAIDAWAIETSNENERGKISGVMFAGQSLGWGISSFLFAYIAENIGFTYVFFIAGLIIAIQIPFTLVFKDSKNIKKYEHMSTVLINEFKKKTTQLISIFIGILYISIGFLIIVVPLYLKVVMGLSISQIGMIVAIFPITIAIGSLVSGFITDIFGRKRALYLFIGISLVFSALFVIADTWQIIAGIYGVIGFLYGGYIVSSFALMMDITNPKVGATQFAILASLANGGDTFGQAISGTLISILGFSRVFLFSAWFLGPPLLLLYFIQYKIKKIKPNTISK